MKPDTERKRYHTEKPHRRKKRLNVHLSKELRSKMKTKKRSLLVRKNDQVRVMRGPGKGKEGKVTRVSVMKRKVYVEGVTVNTAKGREVTMALEASNLLLTSLESSNERKKLFYETAFSKPKAEKPKAKPVEKAEEKPKEKKEKPEEKAVKPEPAAPKKAEAPAAPAAPEKPASK